MPHLWKESYLLKCEICPFTEETVATGEVINQLLHHVGAMCIHQLNLLAASSNSLPLGALLGKQHPIEARHFSSICDIMEKAMVNGDTCIIRCILVVFQVRLRHTLARCDSAFYPGCDGVCCAALLRWCSDFPARSQSRTGRACGAQAFYYGSYLWPLLIT